ncbi:hypothetical protein K440DRAFT_396389 [Wilcoxina mikolae CBS 423.85]|nr:hypothetical protein K440DRAFT_396389 [Wilcoxina mikolae CBS 423.85]
MWWFIYLASHCHHHLCFTSPPHQLSSSYSFLLLLILILLLSPHICSSNRPAFPHRPPAPHHTTTRPTRLFASPHISLHFWHHLTSYHIARWNASLKVQTCRSPAATVTTSREGCVWPDSLSSYANKVAFLALLR